MFIFYFISHVANLQFGAPQHIPFLIRERTRVNWALTPTTTTALAISRIHSFCLPSFFVALKETKAKLAAAMKTTNFPVKGNNNKTDLQTYIHTCLSVCVCMCEKTTPPQRQHKGDCNTKIALKAGAVTTTKTRTMYAQKFDNKK